MRRSLSIFSIFLLCTISSFSQIINPGFEDWYVDPYGWDMPVNWFINSHNHPGTLTQVAGYTGYAVRLSAAETYPYVGNIEYTESPTTELYNAWSFFTRLIYPGET
jgi:hypothetical protein